MPVTTFITHIRLFWRTTYWMLGVHFVYRCPPVFSVFGRLISPLSFFRPLSLFSFNVWAITLFAPYRHTCGIAPFKAFQDYVFSLLIKVLIF